MDVKVFLGGIYINALSYYSNATYVHTGQLFFNDSLSDLVAQQSPYNTHSGSWMLNSADSIYATTGAYTLMNIQYVNSASGVSGDLITSLTLGITSSVAVTTTTAGGKPSGHRPDGNRLGGPPSGGNRPNQNRLNQGYPNNDPRDGYGPEQQRHWTFVIMIIHWWQIENIHKDGYCDSYMYY
jgi:hypothetical protein